jgi:periplasmic copper chaperone A
MRHHFLFLSLLCITGQAYAHEFAIGDITVHHPYAYEVAAGEKSTQAFMTITNDGNDHDHLLRATSPIATSIDIVDGTKILEEQELTENQSLKFKTDGVHLVLNGIKKPIAVGAKQPITLYFESSGAVKAELLFTKADEHSMCDEKQHR